MRLSTKYNRIHDWVIGRAGSFGYATGISDIRITLKVNGKTIEIDYLQKIHLVSPGIVLGFAGSVKIGFEIIEDTPHCGPNCALKFVLNGVRGYEATGQICFILFAPVGSIINWQYIGKRN